VLYPTQSHFGAGGSPPAQGPYATANADELGSKAFATYVGNVAGTLPDMSSQTSSLISPDGSVTTTAEAYIASATIGPFVFDKIHVVASVTSGGGTGRISRSGATLGPVPAEGQAGGPT